MTKSIWDLNQEKRRCHNTFDNTYEDFPVGSRVKIICACQDFYFFYGETGTIIENTGRYLGIHVEFDEPRKFENGYVQTDFNFEPHDLIFIDQNRQPAVPTGA